MSNFKHLISQSILVLCISAVTIPFSSCGDKDTVTPSTDAKPSGLSYDPAELTVEFGTSGMSVTPVVEGTSGFSFSLTSTPDAKDKITINPTNGIISADSTLLEGEYRIDVTVTNSIGETDFKDIYVISVQKSIALTTFEHIGQTINASCSPCHVYGGSSKNYGSSYVNAKDDIDEIIDRIKRDEGSTGFMPSGKGKLDAATIALFEKWKKDGLLEKE